MPNGVELKTFQSGYGYVPRSRGGQRNGHHQRRARVGRDRQGSPGAGGGPGRSTPTRSTGSPSHRRTRSCGRPSTWPSSRSWPTAPTPTSCSSTSRGWRCRRSSNPRPDVRAAYTRGPRRSGRGPLALDGGGEHEPDRGAHVRWRGRTGRPRSDGAAPGDDLRPRDRLAGRRHAGRGRTAGELRAVGPRPDAELHRPADLAGGQRRDRCLQYRRGPGRPADDRIAVPRYRVGRLALVLGILTYRRMDRNVGGTTRSRARSSDRRGSCWRSPSFGSDRRARTCSRSISSTSPISRATEGAFVRGARNTLTLALAGELGGIVIGLVLGVLTLPVADPSGRQLDLHQLLPRARR